MLPYSSIDVHEAAMQSWAIDTILLDDSSTRSKNNSSEAATVPMAGYSRRELQESIGRVDKLYGCL
jgi:hypothetical protein